MNLAETALASVPAAALKVMICARRSVRDVSESQSFSFTFPAALLQCAARPLRLEIAPLIVRHSEPLLYRGALIIATPRELKRCRLDLGLTQ